MKSHYLVTFEDGQTQTVVFIQFGTHSKFTEINRNIYYVCI